MIPGKKKWERTEACRKVERMYQNFGIDTSNMSEEELQAIVDKYIRLKKDLDADLAQSEKHKDKFEDDLI